MTPLELLAPARDAMTAIEAVRHGADAVYIGSPSHGARQSAANSVAEIARVVDYAHQFGARVYVTLNTLVYESEIAEVEALVRDLYTIGVDALIVQDLGLMRMKLPPIALHASTQCDIRTPQKARFLADAGFSQLVLPRELSLAEIAAVKHAVGATPLEAFVHGALCVSYSGDCQASLLSTGRSANRGECAQICRLPFDLIDGEGRVTVRGKHLLSLRDLNRMSSLAEMATAGVSSFKIEGRLKDVTYVKETVGAYRKALDEIIAASAGKYCRSSSGTSTLTFIPDVSRAFNRGFTSYFLKETSPGPRTLSTFDSPKSVGEHVADVSLATRGKRIVVRSHKPLHNGDGLGYYDTDGTFRGFRANRVEGNTIIAATPVEIAKGTRLYRNLDHERRALLTSESAIRTIGVKLTLRATPWGLALDAIDERGCMGTVTAPLTVEAARTPQEERHRKELSRTGDTIYRVTEVTDLAAGSFIPASVLSTLRRDALTVLDRCNRATYHYDYRRREVTDTPFIHTELSYHDNVANSRAEAFYADHGAMTVEKALETGVENIHGPVRVMTTRYCLRRELGACLKTPQGKSLRGPLTLRSATRDFTLEFDCRACRMHVLTHSSNS